MNADSPFHLCSGFHRSGTSLVSLSMIENQVDMGRSLMGPSFGNELGHGEDVKLVNIHDDILKANGLDWRCFENKALTVSSHFEEKMRDYLCQRKASIPEHAVAFGAKDPRALMFLNEWNNACENNIRFILVFRDWKLAVSSLLKRHSKTLLLFNQPMQDRNEDFAFWEHPDLAAKMWLVAAEKMLESQDSWRSKSLLFEQSAFVDKNEELLSKASDKRFNPNILKCSKYNANLMQQSIPESALEMISDGLRDDCEKALSELRKCADVSLVSSVKTSSTLALSRAVVSELRKCTDDSNEAEAPLNLPATRPRENSFDGMSFDDSISQLQAMSKEDLKTVNWEYFLSLPDLSPDQSIKLFYTSVKSSKLFVAELFLLRAAIKRNLHWQWLHLGDHYFALKHFKSAAFCFEKARELMPEHAGILAKLADIETINADYEKAKKLILQAESIDGENVAIQHAKTRLNRALKSTEQDPTSTIEVNQEEPNHVMQLISNYATVLDASTNSREKGKILDSYMMRSNFIMRDNYEWLKNGFARLSEKASLCLSDYLITHLKRDWSDNTIKLALTSIPATTSELNGFIQQQTSLFGGHIVSGLIPGVHLHIYYIELLPEILSFLKFLPQNTRLVITCPSSIHEKLKQFDIFQNIEKLVAVENKGRDIAPWLIEAGPVLQTCDVVLKLHTKSSSHSSSLSGWRLQILWSLIKDEKHVCDILEQFESSQSLGCLMPEFHPHIVKDINWGKNFDLAVNVQNKIGLDNLPVQIDLFPAGSMFWYRPEALQALFDVEWSWDEFPEEEGQLDGTVMHAIERMIGPIVNASRYEIDTISNLTSEMVANKTN